MCLKVHGFVNSEKEFKKSQPVCRYYQFLHPLNNEILFNTRPHLWLYLLAHKQISGLQTYLITRLDLLHLMHYQTDNDLHFSGMINHYTVDFHLFVEQKETHIESESVRRDYDIFFRLTGLVDTQLLHLNALIFWDDTKTEISRSDPQAALHHLLQEVIFAWRRSVIVTWSHLNVPYRCSSLLITVELKQSQLRMSPKSCTKRVLATHADTTCKLLLTDKLEYHGQLIGASERKSD